MPTVPSAVAYMPARVNHAVELMGRVITYSGPSTADRAVVTCGRRGRSVN